MLIDEYNKPFNVRFHSSSLQSACEWLDNNKDTWTLKYEEFMFPHYCGMPDVIIEALDSDDIDWIQTELYDQFFCD